MGQGVILDENIRFSGIRRLEHPPELKCENCGQPLQFTSRPFLMWKCQNNECAYERHYHMEDILAFIDYYNPNQKYSHTTFSNAFFVLKYEVHSEQLEEKFAEAFYKKVEQRIGIQNVDFCVSIPNSTGTQNKIMHAIFQRIAGLRHEPDMIQSSPRISQKDMKDYTARKQNVKGAFALKDPPSVRGAQILVIDDIVTTGSTIDEASRTVAAESGKYVYAACLGKTWRR